ncbi:MAG TPA: hypothetical protein VHM90_13045, partial [Phycisphaerae bacterium]|nr:hypothetical protein [Phycisphaerae bacterium]
WSAELVLKRDHTQADIETLAQKFREDWSEGDVIRSWLRRHSEELRKLVREEDWSWANIGKALSAAGIQFKTGNGWTGENVRRAVDLAMKSRKGRAGKPQATLSAPPPPAVWPPDSLRTPPLSPRPPGEPEFRIIQRGPGSTRRADSAGALASGQSKRGES